MFLKMIQQGVTTTVQCDSVKTRLMPPRGLASGENVPLYTYLLDIEVIRQGRESEFFDFDRDQCMTNNLAGEAGVWLMNDSGKTVDTIFSTS